MAALSPLAALRVAALPYSGSVALQDKLFARLSGARFVLLGEATHGTHEFYRERAAITKRLIAEAGFHAVAIEGDWPDTYRVHRYVAGESDDASAADALSGFRRFPTWMWRNADVLDFVGWLRAHNEALPRAERVAFFGLDLFSMYASIAAILSYLERHDPEAAQHARERYACFEHFSEDAQTYGYATALALAPSCEQQVLEQLLELESRPADDDERFDAIQNARLVMNAEAYYRRMFGGRISTWNLRDRHMTDTLEAIAKELERRVRRPKIVVWAHNTHLGDARATQMKAVGEYNIGQLLRERYGRDVASVGFTTYEGTVIAARDWDAPAEFRRINPALPGSWEALLHELRLPRVVLLCDQAPLRLALGHPRLQRAIGVVYRPRSERSSHYFQAQLVDQFDAVVHIDHSRAVEPLERVAEELPVEPPETYPFAV